MTPRLPLSLPPMHQEDQAPSDDGSSELEEGEFRYPPTPKTSFSSSNVANAGVPPPHTKNPRPHFYDRGSSRRINLLASRKPPRPAMSPRLPLSLPPMLQEDQATSEDGSSELEEGEFKYPLSPKTSFSSSNIANAGVPPPHTKNPRSHLSTAAMDSVYDRGSSPRLNLLASRKPPPPAMSPRLPLSLPPMHQEAQATSEEASSELEEGEVKYPLSPKTSFSSSNIANAGVPPPHTKSPRFHSSTAAMDSVYDRGGSRRINLIASRKPPQPLRLVGSSDAVYSSSALTTLDNKRKKRSVAKKSKLAPMTLVTVVSGERILTSSFIAAKNRSGELVTASCSSADHWVSCRRAVRHVRILFDSLRTFYHGLGVPRGRADLKAARAMKDRGMWLHRDYRIVGDIPGLLIGDVFFYRSELQVVGLHGVPQGGIDYVPVAISSIGDPIGTSIIVSGGYEDDEDKGNELIYIGQGGKQRDRSRLNADQKLRAGNLALRYNKYRDMKVRVIRGFPYDGSPTGKVYVYDGLYALQHFWREKTKSGFDAYKFHLRRAEGQPPMGSSFFKLAEELRARKRPNGYLSWDISGGTEGVYPVRLFNDIDCDNEPLFFEYLSRPHFPTNALVCRGCRCSGVCSLDCECIQKNGGAMPYDLHGILQRGKPMIYECGPSCPCSGSCPNRVSQKGLRYKLEVFRSRSIGWGVRSLDAIRAGAFICEFSGDVLPSEVSPRNSTCLVRPSLFPSRWAEWGNISEVFPERSLPEIPTAVPRPCFTMDLTRARNVGCYLGHSTIPNAFVQPVLYDHNDQSYPHLMVFAMENIPPLTELSIDYGDQDAVIDEEGKFLTF